MNQAIQVDMAGLHKQMHRLAAVTNKTTEQVIANQMGLLLRDSIAFTPPFGDAPIEEGFPAQKQIGLKAIDWQIRSLFYPIVDTKVYKDDSKIGAAVRRLHRKKDIVGLEAVFHRGKFTQEVVRDATSQLHEINRNNWGRITAKRPRYLVVNKPSIKRLILAEQKKIGLGKSVWWPAISRINGFRKTPIRVAAWAKKDKSTGYLVKIQSGNNIGFEAANTVPFLQKHEKHIMRRAAENRARNLPKEVAIAERQYRLALKRQGLL